MIKFFTISLVIVAALVPIATAQESFHSIENPQIDSDTFLQHVTESHQLRSQRRISEQTFMEMAKDPNTIILDARTVERYNQLHVKGAKSLSFTEFTAENLAAVIPSKDTRILIYCNNNFENSPIAFATKAPSASLNLSTYTSLFSYGYRNVYELGPVIDPANSQLQFEGSLSS
ncbi:rhodanese-like domain-containing protein [Lyngbya confervoides]|uniref:Rhodanese-like domain-containing protein n=1 Tax=Lyngbya confervoides BDU141951 TaxID=1574623 RepID=A0ABD4T1R0_9CYAN|nr:rhodanese-like domain-containing protein [Lyngbya confervoides]MCM1982576.1 rhodanese-like domain-containing protein [Lyngbya confervoides BDU141951]